MKEQLIYLSLLIGSLIVSTAQGFLNLASVEQRAHLARVFADELTADEEAVARTFLQAFVSTTPEQRATDSPFSANRLAHALWIGALDPPGNSGYPIWVLNSRLLAVLAPEAAATLPEPSEKIELWSIHRAVGQVVEEMLEKVPEAFKNTPDVLLWVRANEEARSGIVQTVIDRTVKSIQNSAPGETLKNPFGADREFVHFLAEKYGIDITPALDTQYQRNERAAIEYASTKLLNALVMQIAPQVQMLDWAWGDPHHRESIKPVLVKILQRMEKEDDFEHVSKHEIAALRDAVDAKKVEKATARVLKAQSVSQNEARASIAQQLTKATALLAQTRKQIRNVREQINTEARGLDGFFTLEAKRSARAIDIVRLRDRLRVLKHIEKKAAARALRIQKLYAEADAPAPHFYFMLNDREAPKVFKKLLVHLVMGTEKNRDGIYFSNINSRSIEAYWYGLLQDAATDAKLLSPTKPFKSVTRAEQAASVVLARGLDRYVSAAEKHFPAPPVNTVIHTPDFAQVRKLSLTMFGAVMRLLDRNRLWELVPNGRPSVAKITRRWNKLSAGKQYAIEGLISAAIECDDLFNVGRIHNSLARRIGKWTGGAILLGAGFTGLAFGISFWGTFGAFSLILAGGHLTWIAMSRTKYHGRLQSKPVTVDRDRPGFPFKRSDDRRYDGKVSVRQRHQVSGAHERAFGKLTGKQRAKLKRFSRIVRAHVSKKREEKKEDKAARVIQRARKRQKRVGTAAAA